MQGEEKIKINLPENQEKMKADLLQGQLFVFDLDGTLVDAFYDITDAVNYALDTLGFLQLSTNKVRQYVGNGLHKLMERVLKDVAEASGKREPLPGVEEAANLWKEYYLAHPADKARLYPGVLEFLNFLKKHSKIMAVFTNKNHEIAEKVLTKMGLMNYFKEVMGENGRFPRKPEPGGLFFLMEKYSALPAQTWMIGDGEPDIGVARAAGCRLCGVSYGNLGASKLSQYGVRFIVDSLEKILQ